MNKKPFKIVITSLLILCLIMLIVRIVKQNVQINGLKEKSSILDKTICEISSQNEALKKEIASVTNPEYIEQAAREKYGYAKPGERIYYYE